MDSSIVSREIRREVWPALQRQGFGQFSSRFAWKRQNDRIWVVNFQSLNSHFALLDGCTSFSFTLNLGIYLDALRSETQNQLAKPKPKECHFRSRLSKTIEQREYARKDIWYVDPIGGNVLDALDDARSVLLNEGLRWFQRFDANEEVLRTLIHDDEAADLFGIGTRWSPVRKMLIGRFALSIGEQELGNRVLQEGNAEIESIELQRLLPKVRR